MKTETTLHLPFPGSPVAVVAEMSWDPNEICGPAQVVFSHLTGAPQPDGDTLPLATMFVEPGFLMPVSPSRRGSLIRYFIPDPSLGCLAWEYVR